MPDAVSVSVAEAVKTQLAAASFIQEVEVLPERSYADWELELEDSVLRVDVVAVTTSLTAELATRESLQYTVPVDIAVRKRFGTDKQDDDTGRIANSEIDALVYLVQQIHELFTPERLTSFPAGVWHDTKILVSPLIEHLRKFRQFTGIVRVTFAVPQDL